jgi:hypothetical protein
VHVACQADWGPIRGALENVPTGVALQVPNSDQRVAFGRFEQFLGTGRSEAIHGRREPGVVKRPWLAAGDIYLP